MQSIPELKAKIQHSESLITKYAQERKRLELALSQAGRDHTLAQQTVGTCREEHSRAVLDSPGSKEEAAAHGLLRAAMDQLSVISDRRQALETGLLEHKKIPIEQYEGEIVQLRYQIWQAIMEKEFASIQAPVLATMKRAFAASSLGVGAFGTFKDFIAQRLAFLSPNPEEVQKMQDDMKAKYDI